MKDRLTVRTLDVKAAPLLIERRRGGIDIIGTYGARGSYQRTVATINFARRGAKRGMAVRYDEQPDDMLNARLFATAPGLLGICMEMLLDHDLAHDTEDDSYVEPRLIAIARKAIEQLLGEEGEPHA